MNRIKNQSLPPWLKKNSDNSVNSVQKIHQLVPAMLAWFSQNARDLPWRRTRDPYAILVSEIMLQQTQVKTVIPFWERWMRELPTIESLAEASPEKIHKLWEGLGYYTRVRNMQKAAQKIVEEHNGKFPENFDDILALPGIGRYTAGAICSIAFNQPTPILDGNVIRVLTRIFGITENPREKKINELLWSIAEKLVGRAKDAKIKNPLRSWCLLRETNSRTRTKDEDDCCSHLNQSLMELGALICTPRQPKCLLCPAKKLCVAFRENRQDEIPNLGRRAKATERKFTAFVVERDGKFLVRQRPAGVVNAHLWEFPNVEVATRPCEPQQIWAEFNALRVTDPRSEKLERLCTIKHSITRYRITLEAWRAEYTNLRKKPEGHWLTLSELQKLSFPSAHKKILGALAEAG